MTVYPARGVGDRWRAVWYENGQRRQCEAVAVDKLAAKLVKVTERLAAEAPDIERPGADLIAWYLCADRLPAGPPGVAGRPGQMGPQRRRGAARLDDGVPGAPQRPGELPPQGRVDLAGSGRIEQLEAAPGRVRLGPRRLHQAQLGLAEINVKRDTPLAQVRAISQSQLDNDVQQKAQTEAGVQSAKASVAAAEAAVENAQLNLGFTHVRSLITGVAGQATTQVGNLVNTQSVLTAVSQLDPIKVYFSISDAEYLALIQSTHGSGDLLKSETAIPLTLTLANGEVYPSKGRIVFVDRQMNAQTGAIRIAASFPNPNNILRPGQFGRVRGETQLRRNALLIPQVAVQELQGLQQVYIAGADNKAHLTTVELGPQIGANWLVEGGIAPGAQVIVDNLQKLREGAPVNPHPAPATVASAGNPAGR